MLVGAATLTAIAPPQKAAAESADLRGAESEPRPAASDDVGHSGHEDAEGLKVVAETGESVRSGGGGCPAKAQIRNYDVVAIDVDITVNRFLDHDPNGRMYALASDVARIRAEEAQNAEARRGNGPPAVSVGLQGDMIQPLVLRVRQGECLLIRLANQLGGGGGVHPHPRFRPPAGRHPHSCHRRRAPGHRPCRPTGHL